MVLWLRRLDVSDGMMVNACVDVMDWQQKSSSGSVSASAMLGMDRVGNTDDTAIGMFLYRYRKDVKPRCKSAS